VVCIIGRVRARTALLSRFPVMKNAERMSAAYHRAKEPFLEMRRTNFGQKETCFPSSGAPSMHRPKCPKGGKGRADQALPPGSRCCQVGRRLSKICGVHQNPASRASTFQLSSGKALPKAHECQPVVALIGARPLPNKGFDSVSNSKSAVRDTGRRVVPFQSSFRWAIPDCAVQADRLASA